MEKNKDKQKDKNVGTFHKIITEILDVFWGM